MTKLYKLNLPTDRDLGGFETNNKARLSDYMNNYFNGKTFTKESFFNEGVKYVMQNSDFGNRDEKSAETTVKFEWYAKLNSGQMNIDIRPDPDVLGYFKGVINK